MAEFNPRDKSRTERGKTIGLVRKHTSPPIIKDQEVSSDKRWQWFTIEMMESVAFRHLSGNAMKAFLRIVIEHTSHAALNNGRLIVTHAQFVSYGVSGEYVADAIDELEFKGLVKIKRGRSGSGTAHPNVYTLTFVGDCEGAAPTNEWRSCTVERCKIWKALARKMAADKRGKVGRKKKSPLRDSEIRPLRNSEIRTAS